MKSPTSNPRKDGQTLLRSCFRSDGRPKRVFKSYMEALGYGSPYRCPDHNGWHVASVTSNDE